MTPLHILACSSFHDLELYHVIVDNYPANLITEDRWGATPLLYAFWGAAPPEIIQFLLDSYQSLYPDHEFNWTMMMKTLGLFGTPKEHIDNLLHVRQTHFSDHAIDWVYLLDEFAAPLQFSYNGEQFLEQNMKFLFTCGMSSHVEALPFKVWRDHITHMIRTFNFRRDNSATLREIRAKLDHFDAESVKLKETTTILELALWRMMMNEKSTPENATQCQKKIKIDESNIRQQCRVTCGADVVIRHVLPFLINTE
jgi:hypothetical protein